MEEDYFLLCARTSFASYQLVYGEFTPDIIYFLFMTLNTRQTKVNFT